MFFKNILEIMFSFMFPFKNTKIKKEGGGKRIPNSEQALKVNRPSNPACLTKLLFVID